MTMPAAVLRIATGSSRINGHAVTGLAVVALIGGACLPLHAQRVRVGTPVSIDVMAGADGRLTADEIEILDSGRSLTVGGRARDVDRGLRRFTVLGLRVRTDAATRRPDGSTLDFRFVREGAFVEVRLDQRTEEGWHARSVQLDEVKPTAKIKGVVRAVRSGTALDVLDVDGVLVTVDSATDIVHPSDYILEDLFAELSSDDGFDDGTGEPGQSPALLSLSASLRAGYRREDAFSLAGPADDRLGVGEPGARLEARLRPVRGVTVFAQGRLDARYTLEADAPGGAAPDAPPRAELRQLYLSIERLGLPIGVTVGRQRLRDDREFLFDEYLDAVRVYLYPLRPLVLEATFIEPVSPLEDRFAGWHDRLVQARFYAGPGWTSRLYALHRRDDSSRQRNSRYYGIGIDGETDHLRLWFEGALLRGEDKGREQDAYGVDGGLALRFTRRGVRPYIAAGFALGSGDRDRHDNVSNLFRQTGYDDNSSRLWDVTRFRHYGEAFNPELANLRILSAAIGIRPVADASIEIIAHEYRLDRPDADLVSTGLNVPDGVLDGDDRGLGREVDVVVGVRDLLGHLSLGYRAGVFFPGDAFGAAARPALLQRAELRIDL